MHSKACRLLISLHEKTDSAIVALFFATPTGWVD